jgi:hypothetical protein
MIHNITQMRQHGHFVLTQWHLIFAVNVVKVSLANFSDIRVDVGNLPLSSVKSARHHATRAAEVHQIVTELDNLIRLSTSSLESRPCESGDKVPNDFRSGVMDSVSPASASSDVDHSAIGCRDDKPSCVLHLAASTELFAVALSSEERNFYSVSRFLMEIVVYDKSTVADFPSLSRSLSVNEIVVLCHWPCNIEFFPCLQGSQMLLLLQNSICARLQTFGYCLLTPETSNWTILWRLTHIDSMGGCAFQISFGHWNEIALLPWPCHLGRRFEFSQPTCGRGNCRIDLGRSCSSEPSCFSSQPFDSGVVSSFPSLFDDFCGKWFVLLWRGSRAGFRARDFHGRCDGHANTLTLILDTGGNVFGGFAPLQWESAFKLSEDSKCAEQSTMDSAVLEVIDKKFLFNKSYSPSISEIRIAFAILLLHIRANGLENRAVKLIIQC